jgi:hypothetical protein
LATRAAELVQQGGIGASAALTELVKVEAARHQLAPWTLTSLIAGEWARQGIVVVPGSLPLADVPRGTVR